MVEAILGWLKLDLTGLFLTPKIFRKEMDNIYIYYIFMYTFKNV